MFITDQTDLEAFVERAHGSSVLAIDTEFLREKTYYAKLCLLQMQTDDETVIVDPFAVEDLSALSGLFEDASVVKLFHAGSQDIEILYREVGCMPKPVFDTQIAASVLGHTLQIGYGSLVSSLCGVQLAKVDSFTDWSRRPLSDSQIEYAADDVLYLPRMYVKLKRQLKRLGRLHWLDEDFDALIDPATYEADPRERYRRLKRVGQLNRRQLGAAREVAAWRENFARSHNIPRKWVLTDEQVVEACKREASTIDELFMVRGISDKLSTKDARSVVACIKRGLSLPPEDLPHNDRSQKSEANVDVEVDAMTAIVRLRARESDIAFQTLATHSDLAKVARGHTDVDILKGWRREIVGKELLDFMDGKISLHVEDGNLTVTKRM